MNKNHAIALLVAIVGSGGAAYATAPLDATCSAISAFSDATVDNRPHSVRFMGNASGSSFALSCPTVIDKPEATFCASVLKNASPVSMMANIEKIMWCAGFYRMRWQEHLGFESLAGKFVDVDPVFTVNKVTMEVEFDSAPRVGAPWLVVTVRKHGEK
jgi:hypothetical protein